MKRLLFGLLAYTCTMSAANAADMVLKATPAAVIDTCTPTNCSGFYFGADLTGVGSNMDILGSGIRNSVFAGGGMVGLHGGYQLWNGAYFAAAEAGCAFETANNLAVVVQQNTHNRLFCSELFKFGVGLSSLFGGFTGTAPAVPSQGPQPITVPAQLSNALMAPYMLIGAAQRFHKTGWATGAGATFILARGWNLDLSYMRVTYGAKPEVGPDQTLQNENLVRLSLNRKF